MQMTETKEERKAPAKLTQSRALQPNKNLSLRVSGLGRGAISNSTWPNFLQVAAVVVAAKLPQSP